MQSLVRVTVGWYKVERFIKFSVLSRFFIFAKKHSVTMMKNFHLLLTLLWYAKLMVTLTG